jgi:hypothetical protein
LLLNQAAGIAGWEVTTMPFCKSLVLSALLKNPFLELSDCEHRVFQTDPGSTGTVVISSGFRETQCIKAGVVQLFTSVALLSNVAGAGRL